MSGESGKRLKTTAVATERVSIIDSLPTELLEKIVGFQDVRTLCTARCVSTKLCDAASRCIPSVELSIETLRSQPETTLNNFPNLERVSIFGVREGDIYMLAETPVAAAVTHVRAVEHLRLMPRCGRTASGAPLLRLPNLMSLTIKNAGGSAFGFPQTLRELTLKGSSTLRTANLVAMLTNLTRLHIAIDTDVIRKPFEAMTALTALQHLDISCNLSINPFIAELTQLTHLQIKGTWHGTQYSVSTLAPLTRLHRLVHLGEYPLPATTSFELQVLASIATFSSLRSLDLKLCGQPEHSPFETACMAPFSQLTALRLHGGWGWDVNFLPRFYLERLQDLSLSDELYLNRDGIAALTRATGLTRLQLSPTMVHSSVQPEEVEAALSHMSQLRALFLGAPTVLEAVCSATPDAVPTTFSLRAIAAHTELTRLELSGRGVTTNANAEVCLGLKKLRVLSMFVPVSDAPPSDRITLETFLAIAKLPELHKLEVIGNVGISRGDLTDKAREGFNAERLDKGWPPLKLNI